MKKILLRSLMLLMLPTLISLQSCKSDEENLFDEFYSTASDCTITYGETEKIISVNENNPIIEDEEIYVVPASVGTILNLNVSCDNEYVVSIIEKDGDIYARGIGIGETTISIHNAKNELLKQIKVRVDPPYTLKDFGEKTEIKYGRAFSVFKEEKVNYSDLSYISFTSTDNNVARVNAEGDIIPYNLGETTISIKYRGLSYPVKEFKVTVVPTYSIDMTCAQIQELSYYTDAEDAQKTFSTTDGSVAYVNNSEKTIEAYNVGSAFLKATNCMIKVTVAPMPGSINIIAPWVPTAYNCKINEVKTGMAAYTLEYEG